MRRRRNPKSGGAGVSLFPFLAVLLCTMGALIVVLIVIARQSRPDLEDSEATAANAALQEEWERKQADLKWRIEQLRSARKATLAQLETQRQELSHLEDHARRLRSQLEELEHARKEFDGVASGERLEHDRLKQQIAEAESQIAAKKAEIDEARRKARRGGGSYAVVPYHGPNETRRRPIYIECRADGVVFQPEGLVLTEKDFDGDLGPGNPLASALRAAREYLSRTQMPGEGAPYPLLLIRPDGVLAYECVINAMSSWGSEFGYELIGQDWPLEFPPPDPQLALAMRQAIGEGRLRQAYLARAAPRLMQAGQHASFRASPTGGIMRDDGMPMGREPRSSGRGHPGGRSSWSRGLSERGQVAGARSGGDSDGSKSKKLSGNPYRAALASQAHGGGAGGEEATGGGADSILGGGAGGDSILGFGAAPGGDGPYSATKSGGDRYGRGGSGLARGTGSAPSAGDSPSGGAGGSSSSNLLAASSGRASAQSTRYGTGNGSGRYGDRQASSGGPYGAGGRYGGAPGTGGTGAAGAGRGWGMAQEKVAAGTTRAGSGRGGAKDGAGGNGSGNSAVNGKDGAGMTGGTLAAGAAAAAAGTTLADSRSGNRGGGLGAGSAGAGSGGAGNGTGSGGSGSEAGGAGGGVAGQASEAPTGASTGAGTVAAAPAGATGATAAVGQGTGTGGAGKNGSGGGGPGQNATGEGNSPGGAAGEGPALADAKSGATSGATAGKAGAKGGNAKQGSAVPAPGLMAQTGSSTESGSTAGGSIGQTGNGSGASGGSAGSPGGGGTSAGGNGGQGAGGSQQQQASASGMPALPNLTLGQQPKSIAEETGEQNWANPAANHYSFPVTRPIKVVCDADHLTVLPEGRTRRGYKVIELNEQTEDGVRELVESVWDRVETWGAAGRGMYWRPELLMEVEPGGERRYAELKSLLADSGLDVRGRRRRAPVIQYPRTRTPN